MKKVIFCVPTYTRPYKVCLEALEKSIPLIRKAGWDDSMVSEIGCPYVSVARSKMLRKALDVKADVIVFIDHDLTWEPADLLKLIETEGDVVSGTYRFKREPEEYMGSLFVNNDGTPIVRADGCIKAQAIPAGFLKITKDGVNRFMKEWPGLCFGDRYAPCIDLFNHGAHDWTWYGEDYAFSRRWNEKCGPIWIIPDLSLTHWSGETPYPGNFHEFLLRQPGGSNAPKETQ